MNLYELAFTCYIYNFFTTFNNTYKELREATGGCLDLSRQDHRIALIKWLNKWGCRQFALGHHEEASRELFAWHREGRIKKMPLGKKLWDLNEQDLDQAGVVYDTLACRIASRAIRGDREILKTFGPTGASKILFALKPDIAAPWDSYIRNSLGYSGTGSSYVEYLKRLVEEINELKLSCIENSYHLNEVPKIIDRDGSTIPQLVGEYFWVIETRNCYPPEHETLQDWANWSKKTFGNIN